MKPLWRTDGHTKLTKEQYEEASYVSEIEEETGKEIRMFKEGALEQIYSPPKGHNLLFTVEGAQSRSINRAYPDSRTARVSASQEGVYLNEGGHLLGFDERYFLKDAPPHYVNLGYTEKNMKHRGYKYDWMSGNGSHLHIFSWQMVTRKYSIVEFAYHMFGDLTTANTTQKIYSPDDIRKFNTMYRGRSYPMIDKTNAGARPDDGIKDSELSGLELFWQKRQDKLGRKVPRH